MLGHPNLGSPNCADRRHPRHRRPADAGALPGRARALRRAARGRGRDAAGAAAGPAAARNAGRRARRRRDRRVRRRRRRGPPRRAAPPARGARAPTPASTPSSAPTTSGPAARAARVALSQPPAPPRPRRARPVRRRRSGPGLGAIRREAFDAVGGFDAQRFPRPSIEDVELGMRLHAAGRADRARPGRARHAPQALDAALDAAHRLRRARRAVGRAALERGGAGGVAEPRVAPAAGGGRGGRRRRRGAGGARPRSLPPRWSR